MNMRFVLMVLCFFSFHISFAEEVKNPILWKKALRIHKRAIVVDGHNDITSPMVDEKVDIGVSSKGQRHTDLSRMKEGGLTAEFFSIYVDGDYASKGGSARRAMDLIDSVYRATEKYPQQLKLSTSVQDIRASKIQGKVAALMGIEGGHAIENSLSALRIFYRLGVRYMTLTHNNTNDWADAAKGEAKHNGLSEFGKEVVREMNRLGMLVDVSHVSDKTMKDVLDLSKAPVIASHSCAKHFSDHPRNINDELLQRIAQNDGVVMINFYTSFLDQESYNANKQRDIDLKSELDAIKSKYVNNELDQEKAIKLLYQAHPIVLPSYTKIVDHIDHIVKVAGIRHVGLGSDFDGGIDLPMGMKGVEDLALITYELLKRGYLEKDILRILGENFLRVFAKVEAVAGLKTRSISGQGSEKKFADRP